ncbi:Pyrophosphate--fructose 6-phosphate 1-phosphotransferase subunit alpha 2 [Zea mays]|uniref:Pyrophosphate--fructose 6-phosphate 1-phosphotransferase subunit alpha 2 n=1 Tax=Zea mays TaxID=4577 RepID=A0A1D6LP87_MAIZE|nr:Pyrophosphate--fructose 6-phosphate 1-phosphotransferase subunit alpha 2 [Zea mays]AQK81310.1 Pyrophosphate--fructose 6-phosphate 1-phosphotransferase subunit alpha 2 [Zea mays]AQK81311.1 Pyrophosphate--fructose 6-phosphate 1-phosphotransferase subunit alpha 2 [Zea mays]AQK81320.1 Pyrophosphate--fructose 6-phosphate 1-phosphotransferase subunit alpha 2 [Zea mays]
MAWTATSLTLHSGMSPCCPPPFPAPVQPPVAAAPSPNSTAPRRPHSPSPAPLHCTRRPLGDPLPSSAPNLSTLPCRSVSSLVLEATWLASMELFWKILLFLSFQMFQNV